MHQRSDNRSSSRITPTRSGTSVSSRSRNSMSTRSDSRLPPRRRTGCTPKPSVDEKYATAPSNVISVVDKPTYVTTNGIEDMKGNVEHSFKSLEGNKGRVKVSYHTNDECRYKNGDLINLVCNGSKKAKLPKLNQKDFPFPVKCILHKRLRPADVLKISSTEQWQGPDPLELQRIENEFEMYAYQYQIAYLDGLIEEGEELIRQSRQTEEVLRQQYAFLDSMDMYEDKVKESKSGKKSTDPNFDTRTLSDKNIVAGNAFDVKFSGHDSGIDLNMSVEKNGSNKKVTRGINTIKLQMRDKGTQMYEPLLDTRQDSMVSKVTGNTFDVKFGGHDRGIDLNMSVEKNGSNKKVTRGINTIELQMRDKGTQIYKPLLETRQDSMLSKVTLESKCVQTDLFLVKTILTHLKIDTVREDEESKLDTERNLEPMMTANDTRNEEEVIESERSLITERDSKLNEEITFEDEETSEKVFDNNVDKEYVHEEFKPELSCVPTVLPALQSFRLSDDQLNRPDISKTGVQFENSLCADGEQLNVSKIISAMRCVTRVHEDRVNKVKDQRKLLKPAHRLKKEMEIAMLKEEFAKFREIAIDPKDIKETNVRRGSANHGDRKSTDAKDFLQDADDKIVRISNDEMLTCHELGEKSDKYVVRNNQTNTETQSKVHTNLKSAKPRVDTWKQHTQSKVDDGRKSSQYKPYAGQRLVRSKIENESKVDTGRNAAQTKMNSGRNVVRLPKIDSKSNSNRRQPSVQSRAKNGRNMATEKKQRASSKINTSFDNSFAKPEPKSKYFDKQSSKSNAKSRQQCRTEVNVRAHDKAPVRNAIGNYKLPPINDCYDSKEKNSKASTISVEKRKAEAMFISFSPSPPVDKMPNSPVQRRPSAKEPYFASVARKEASLKPKHLSHGEDDTIRHGILKQNAQNTNDMNKITSGAEKKCSSNAVYGTNINKNLTKNEELLGHTRQKPKAEALWVSFSPLPPLGHGLPADTKQNRPSKPGSNNLMDNQKAKWSEKFYRTIDGLNPIKRNGSIFNDMNETPTKEDTAPIDIRPPERKNAEALWVSFSPTPPRVPPPRLRRKLNGENGTKVTGHRTCIDDYDN